jgi:hypothetical protein
MSSNGLLRAAFPRANGSITTDIPCGRQYNPIPQEAQRLGVNERSLRRYIALSLIPYVRLGKSKAGDRDAAIYKLTDRH